jgi:hypothetical protein
MFQTEQRLLLQPFSFMTRCFTLPYYLAKKNELQVKEIISKIDWKQYPFKYKLYYKWFPRVILKIWFEILKYLSVFKNNLQKLFK